MTTSMKDYKAALIGLLSERRRSHSRELAKCADAMIEEDEVHGGR